MGAGAALAHALDAARRARGGHVGLAEHGLEVAPPLGAEARGLRGRTPRIPRGATFDGAETSFAVYARHADAVELCAAARGTLTVEARSVVVLSRPAARP